MSICDVEMDIDEIASKIVGAGVLPVTVSHQNKIEVLLGKEHFVHNWKSSLKWSSFEGGRKRDESFENAAAREFVEESMGVVELDPDGNMTSVENVLRIIETNRFLARVVMCVNHNERQQLFKRYHIMYMIEVPPQYFCPIKFGRKRIALLQLSTKLLKYNDLINRCIMWGYPFLREGMIHNDKVITAITHAHVHHKKLFVRYKHYNTHLVFTQILHTSMQIECAKVYIQWYNMRYDLNKDVQKFNYLLNAVTVTYNTESFFLNATINHDFLEKEQIRWWNIDELSFVLDNNGSSMDQEQFRPYFIPMMKRCVEELRTSSALWET